MSITFKQQVYPLTSFDAASSNTQDLALTAAVGVGDLIVVRGSWGGGTSQSTVTVTDSGGNTYTVPPTAWVSANNEDVMAICIATHALTTSDHITVATNIARVKREYRVVTFTGAGSMDGAAVTGTGSSTNPTLTVPTTQAGDLVLGLFTLNGPQPTITWDAAYTGVATLSTAVGTADKVFTSAYRIAGASGTETPNVTLSSSRSWAGVAIAVQAAVATVQTARPASDITTAGWTVVPSGAPSLASVLDETVSDDTDYIQSPTSPSGVVFEVKLGPLPTPTDKTGHKIRFRMEHINATSNSVSVDLVQGTTIIAHFTQVATNAFVEYVMTLTTAQATAITDYTDLRVRGTVTAT